MNNCKSDCLLASMPFGNTEKAALINSCSDTAKPCSLSSRITPSAARRNANGQLAFLIGLDEEAGVRYPRPDYTLIALDYVPRVGELHVRNNQKIVGQLPTGIKQRKIFLVLAHGQDQAFRLHGQKT